jgi:hypothetical protein
MQTVGPEGKLKFHAVLAGPHPSTTKQGSGASLQFFEQFLHSCVFVVQTLQPCSIAFTSLTIRLLHNFKVFVRYFALYTGFNGLLVQSMLLSQSSGSSWVSPLSATGAAVR